MKNLLKEYDFKTVYGLFNYMVESYMNGQKTQAKEIQGKLIEKAHFRSEEVHLAIFSACEIFGDEKCIKILLKLNFTKSLIINSFHDHGTIQQFDEINLLISELKQENYNNI